MDEIDGRGKHVLLHAGLWKRGKKVEEVEEVEVEEVQKVRKVQKVDGRGPVPSPSTPYETRRRRRSCCSGIG